MLSPPLMLPDIEFPETLQSLFMPKRYKVLYGGRGAGRCLGKNTQVMMSDGSLRLVQDIKTNDYLMGPDSKPRRVLGTTTGFGPLFKVTQRGGGASYIVNSNHILSLKKTHNVSVRADRKSLIQVRYKDYPDVCNVSIGDYLGQSPKWRSHFLGYKAGLIDFGSFLHELPIDPYFLGMWLGDGTSRELRITCFIEDMEILKYCAGYVRLFGLKTNIYEKPGIKAYDVGFGAGNGKANPLWDVFVRLGLKNDKHIPFEYQIASEKDRLKLLAGLVDSDGYMNNNGYEFANTNSELAWGVKRLADFLGFKTNMHIVPAKGREATKYRLSINGDVWRVPCLLERKKIKKQEVSKNKDFLLRGISVESCGDGEFFGFELDGDHLFLLEDGTVTHNSWGCARALLVIGAQRPIRVLCAREFQNSISESVHKVLSDQISAMGYDKFYTIQANRIIGLNGTSFAFEGIKNNTSKIKSYEGIDYCWVEEAEKVSRMSWEILIPTIRKEGSEIWITFNPGLDTDYTYKRFVREPDSNLTSVMFMTYKDNPWFPEVLRLEMEDLKKRDMDAYLNVWEGHPRQMLEGVVYAKELRRADLEDRIRQVPWERSIPVDVTFDLGRANNTAMWFTQRVAMEFRVLKYYEANLEEFSHYLKVCQDTGFVFGVFNLPHDAKARRLGTKHTIQEQVRLASYRDRIVPNLKLVDGIDAARKLLGSAYFDEVGCEDGLNALRHYRYRVIDGQLSNDPLHDWASDGADAWRYVAVAQRWPKDKTQTQASQKASSMEKARKKLVESIPGLGWLS